MKQVFLLKDFNRKVVGVWPQDRVLLERYYLELSFFDQLDHLLDQVEAIDSFDWLVELSDDIAFGDK